MSEALPGVPAMPPSPPATARDAAAVILYRHAPAGLEVFWLKRDKALRFGAGFFAFPGGKVDRDDAAIAVQGAQGLDAALIAAAARELFEETGVLKARGAETLPPLELDEARRAVLAQRERFGDLLRERGFSLHADDFVPAGRWMTPPFLPVRFDARFYLVEAPHAHPAVVWPGELEWGGWVDAYRRAGRVG